MQPSPLSASERNGQRLWWTLAAACVLVVASLSVFGEWLAAWFSYGTYSALFTYGAIGIPALVYLVWSRGSVLEHLVREPRDRWLGLALLAAGCTLALAAASKDLRFAGVFVGVVAIAVLHWGRRAPLQLWQELGLFLLAIPFPFVFALTHNTFFQSITAHGAAFMLWYVGVPAVSDGVHLSVLAMNANGTWSALAGVIVAEECSGTAIGFTLTYLGFLIPALLPVSPKRRVVLSLVGPLMAVFCNTARVGFLVFVQAFSGRAAFDFWHAGDGRLVYSFGTLLLYGLIALWIVWPALHAPVSEHRAG